MILEVQNSIRKKSINFIILEKSTVTINKKSERINNKETRLCLLHIVNYWILKTDLES